MELKLLIVEDDRLLAEAVSDYFSGKGWETDVVYDGDSAVEKAEQKSYQMILLDVMLPGRDGFSVCRKIREMTGTPVFFITKPFSLPVLYAKVMAMTGRLRGGAESEMLVRGDVTVNVRTRSVRIGGEACPLAPKEYELLVLFLENPNRIFTRDQLLIRLWGYDFEGNERVVDNHIKKLRKALAFSRCRIHTVRKSGYRMEVSV
ncbi:MAG TPA: response regulator transcription factor [Candidatus Mediterraneibacter faecipullorum]|uniref:Stage 0 sporulation protein A homolog n=1 Tax=Candidatus Mediterraneibacter faecipullorum TaxID=2838670 RepID=A0A9D2SU88_9FIRM|nr:response regulator transcription factor [Candidatus Mediterraneibacter faecipullorum]